MKTLIVMPLQKEIDPFLRACVEQGFQTKVSKVGRLHAVQLPDLDITLACGGLGKVQFAVQTQHLLDASPDWDVVICAGTAGALVEDLAVGDVVVSTETVEHDILNKFGEPLLPRFGGAETVVSDFRSVALDANSFFVHFAPIASGDEDVIDTQRKRLLHKMTGAFAVAWEGAGGARACHFSNVPFVEIRGVTDNADSDAASVFESNLEGAMRNVATLIISWAGGLLA